MRGYFDHPMGEQVQTSDLGPAYDLEFPWARPPLTANDRMHCSQKARWTKIIRETTGWKAARLPELPAIRVSLTWVVKDRRRRDGGENLTPTLKPMIDGLVDAGVVPDDDPRHVIRDMPVIRFEAGGVPRLILHVAPLTPEAAAA